MGKTVTCDKAKHPNANGVSKTKAHKDAALRRQGKLKEKAALRREAPETMQRAAERLVAHRARLIADTRRVEHDAAVAAAKYPWEIVAAEILHPLIDCE